MIRFILVVLLLLSVLTLAASMPFPEWSKVLALGAGLIAAAFWGRKRLKPGDGL